MDAVEKLEQMLAARGIEYEWIHHPAAYTAQMTAEIEHVAGAEEAKVVVLNADGKDVLAALPSTRRVDLRKMAAILGAKSVTLESESEFSALFPDSEPGAMPPFGALYGMLLYADRSLSENEDIVFNAGSHREAVRMKYDDYEKIARPAVCDFAVRWD